MEHVFTFIYSIFTNLYGIAGLVALSYCIYWLFSKEAKKRQIAELRKRMDEMSPTDPEYNQVRMLYISMMIESTSGVFFNSFDSSPSSDCSSHGDISHSGHDHSGSHYGGDCGSSYNGGDCGSSYND